MDNNSQLTDKYLTHKVFQEIEYLEKFYEKLSYGCFRFVPLGAMNILNYASYIYLAIQNTFASIKTILTNGAINDAFVLVRKLFDDVLVEIYINVLRLDKNDFKGGNLTVKEVDEWLTGKYRIPTLKKLLKKLETLPSTKDLYPFFEWETDLKKCRDILDDSVHSNRFSRMLLNCKSLFIENRENYLDSIYRILNHIFTIHLSFTFYINGHYFMSSDYVDHLELGLTPPKDSQKWIAHYAQEAFDKFIKPKKELSAFIKEHCGLNIQ